MSSQSLKYGHIIRIKSNDNTTHNYITSKSYTDPKLYFQTYGYEENQSNFDVSNYRQSLFQVLPTSSFQINDEMNSIKNQTKKAETLPRAKTQQEQFKTIIQQKKGKSIFFGDKVVFRHLDSKHYIYGSFQCASSGIGAFKIDLRQQLSEKLIFQLLSYRTYQKDGDQISIDAPLKIYHAQTQCYLSFCMERIFLDRTTYQQKGIQPKRQKYQAQHIQINQQKNFHCQPPSVKLFHYKKKNSQKDILKRIPEERQFQSNDLHQQLQIQQDLQKFLDQKSRYEIINQNIAKRIWKFEPYIDVQLKTNRQLIRNHDIVYLLHTKDDKYLAPNNFDTSISLNKRIEAADPQNIFDGLWQIQQRQQTASTGQDDNLNKSKMPNRKGPNLAATFKASVTLNLKKTTNLNIKNQAQKESELKKKKSYSLRHLMSGRLLYFSEPKGQNIFIQLLHSQQLKQRNGQRNISCGFVLLQCLDSNLTDGTLTRLSIDNGKAYLQIKSKIQKKFLKNQDLAESQEMDFAILKFDQQFGNVVEKTYQSNFQKQQLLPTKDASQHGFRVYKADQNVKEIALKIMSSQQIIFKFTDFLLDYNQKNKDDDKDLSMSLLNNVINVIKDLIGFIFGCQYSKIVESGNSPISLRQRAFDQLGMVQLITSLLNQIQKQDNKLKDIASKSSQYKKIRTIYVLGFEVLQSMAVYNNMLKVKISKYLPTYLKHILQPRNRVVYKSIQQIIDGNQLALQNQVQLNYISSLIKTFGQGDSTTDPADLQFLSKLCLCKNKTVKKNQDDVFTAFYQSIQNEKNRFVFKADHGKYQISSKISKKQDARLRTLPELFLECQMSLSDGVLDPSKGHWNYFMQYLNLLADVCVGRNNTPINYILQNLPLTTLNEFLQQKVIRNQQFHQPFIRLIHHAFVQTAEYKQISRITKVKNWITLGQPNEVPKLAQPISPNLGNIIDLITSYIKKINKQPWRQDKQKTKKKQIDIQPTSIQFNPGQIASLNNVNTFLEALKSTLILGFWPTIQSMKKIVPYILKIMAFDYEYAKQLHKRIFQQKQIPFVTQEDFDAKVYRKVKQQLRLNKPKIVLLVQCKILAAQILDIIIDYQFNIRVSSITSYFRKVQEQEVDLTKYPYDQWAFKKKWNADKQYNLFAPENQKEGYLMNQQLWIDQINRTIQQGNVFRFCEQQCQINFLLVLFESFIYGNQQLTDLVLKILIRVTSQRRGLLNTFKEIILVAGGNLNQLTKRVLKTRSTLLKLTNQQIMSQTPNNHLWCKTHDLHSQNIELGTIQQLAFLTIAMKKGSKPTQAKASKFYQMSDLYPFFYNSFYDRYSNEHTNLDKSYLVITQKQQNNPLNQNLIKSQDHHLLIFTFIKITQKVSKQNKQFFMLSLHASYNFLTTLVWNNIQNKNQLQPFLAEAQNHLAINVGSIDFFQQMYKNNKKLVIKTDVTRIVNKIIQIANQQDFFYYYHKSKLLDFLRNIIIFDNKGVAKNQNIVMEIISQYQVSDNNQIVYLDPKVSDDFSKTIDKNYKQWMNEYQKDYDKTLKGYDDLLVSPQLFYIATFFQIFSGLIQNQNKVNIGKCTNMHPHSFLMKILQSSRNCWPVIRHLRSYVNKLYYLTSDKQTQLYTDFLQHDLPNIERQMKDIIILIANSPDYHSIKIKNPIRYAYLGSYIFLALEECLNSISLMFPDNGTKNDAIKYLKNLLGQQGSNSEKNYHSFLFIMEMIEYLMKTIDGRAINKYLAKVSKIIRQAISQVPLHVVMSYLDKQKSKMAQNMKNNHFNADQVMYRKNYIFHDNKGFWKHLIDWNAHYHQQLQRQKAISAISKKTDQQSENKQSPDAQQKKKRDYLIQKISLGNIQKLILFRDPLKRISTDKDKQQKNEEYQGNKQQTKQQEAEDMLPKNLITSQSQRFKVKNQRFDNPELKNMIINSRRKKLVKFIQVNPIFNKFSQEQTQKVLYKGFASLTEMSKSKYGSEIVGRTDVIKTLVQMNKKDPKSIKIQYKVQIVKMLISYIQKDSNIFSKSIQQWTASDLEQWDKVKQAQSYLNSCNCSQFLCSLFENDLNTSLQYSNEIILFGICLLIGKNQEVQKKILQILKKDEKNVILIQLGQLIKKNQLNVQLFSSSGKSIERFEFNYSDTYDFYNDNQKIMERKYTYIPETVLQQKQLEQKMIFLQRIFIFLKVLCEGSNHQIKNYIRQQTTNDQQKKVKTQSINFIGLSAVQLKRLLADFKIQVVKVSYAIVDFIYQVTQIPCVNNQLFLCKNTSYFHDFAQLQKTISDNMAQLEKINSGKIKGIKKQDMPLINQLFARNIKNCISCLQGNHQQIRQSLISDDLIVYYVSIFVQFINQLKQQSDYKFENHLQLEKCMLQHDVFSGKILNLFDITTVIVKLKIKYKKFDENTKIYLDGANKKKQFQLFEKQLLGIQIYMKQEQADSDLTQIQYFPRHSVYNYLSRATRNTIMQQINRSTQRDKIIGLINTRKIIQQQIKYNFTLDHDYKLFGFPISISATKIGIYQNIALIFSVLICILMTQWVNVVYYPYDQAIQYELGAYKTIIKILSTIQFLFAMIYTGLWMFNHIKLAAGKYDDQIQSMLKKDGQVQKSSIRDFLFKIPGFKSLYCLLFYDTQFSGILLFVAGSALGNLYRPEWFSILFISMMMSSMDVLKNMIASITTKINILGMLSLLGTAFIGIFSIFSINFYVQSLYQNQLPKEHCQTVMQCIIQLYIKQQIGSQMQSFQTGRFFFDMIYTIFMQLLFGNIVSGVLIDTFTQLRQKREQIQKDKQGMCFICGITKQILQKKNENIKTHYRHHCHKLWNYVFYIFNLNLKSNKVGLEYIIQQKIDDEDVSWVPAEGADQQDIGEKIQQLESAINQQKKFIDQIQAAEG